MLLICISLMSNGIKHLVQIFTHFKLLVLLSFQSFLVSESKFFIKR